MLSLNRTAKVYISVDARHYQYRSAGQITGRPGKSELVHPELIESFTDMLAKYRCPMSDERKENLVSASSVSGPS